MHPMKGHYGQYDSTSYVAASDAKLGNADHNDTDKKSSGSSRGKMKKSSHNNMSY